MHSHIEHEDEDEAARFCKLAADCIRVLFVAATRFAVRDVNIGRLEVDPGREANDELSPPNSRILWASTTASFGPSSIGSCLIFPGKNLADTDNKSKGLQKLLPTLSSLLITARPSRPWVPWTGDYGLGLASFTRSSSLADLWNPGMTVSPVQSCLTFSSLPN